MKKFQANNRWPLPHPQQGRYSQGVIPYNQVVTSGGYSFDDPSANANISIDTTNLYVRQNNFV